VTKSKLLNKKKISFVIFCIFYSKPQKPTRENEDVDRAKFKSDRFAAAETGSGRSVVLQFADDEILRLSAVLETTL
jgi:hypothetical protein